MSSVLACILLAQLEASVAASPTWEDGQPLALQDIVELDLEDLLSAPLIHSAARRKQSIEDAPAAMDAFSGDEIARAGITSLADLLRRVPGMYVVQTNAGRFDVGMRGVSSLGNNRILVLLNGQRLVELDRESPAWSTFPVHVGEIESVEILRGPGSMVFGANALSGVINISTKRPLDHEGVDALFAGGNGYLAQTSDTNRSAMVSNLGTGYASYTYRSASGKLGTSMSAGANLVPDWSLPDPSTVQRYGNFGFHTGGTVEYRASAQSNLLVDFRDSRGESRFAVQNLKTPISVDSSMQSMIVRYRKEKLTANTTLTADATFHRRLERNRRFLARNMLSPASDTNPMDVLARVERVNYRGQVLAQLDTELPSLRSILSIGMESSRQLTTQLEGGDYAQIYTAAYVQTETRLFQHPELLLSLGARAERVAVTSDEKGEARSTRVSPRGSLIAKLSPDHTLRLSFATAYRMPALGEVSNSTITSSLPASQAGAPPTYSIWGNFFLRPEQVRSAEAGYRGRPMRWLRIDGTVYVQQLLDPVRILRQQLPIAYENGGRQWQAGVELGLKIQPTANTSVHASYAFSRTHATDTNRSTGDFPTHLAQIGSGASSGKNQFNVDFAFAGAIDPLIFERDSSGALIRRSTSSRQLLLNARLGRRILDDRVEAFLMGNNLLSPFRADGELLQYPMGGASPIGLTVLAGVQVRESGRWGRTP